MACNEWCSACEGHPLYHNSKCPECIDFGMEKIIASALQHLPAAAASGGLQVVADCQIFQIHGLLRWCYLSSVSKPDQIANECTCRAVSKMTVICWARAAALAALEAQNASALWRLCLAFSIFVLRDVVTWWSRPLLPAQSAT